MWHHTATLSWARTPSAFQRMHGSLRAAGTLQHPQESFSDIRAWKRFCLPDRSTELPQTEEFRAW